MKHDAEFFTAVEDVENGYPMCGNAGQSLTDPPPRSGKTTTYKRCDSSVGQRFLCCVDGVPKALAFDAGQAERFTERHAILLVDLVVEVIPLRRCSEQSAAAVDGVVDRSVAPADGKPPPGGLPSTPAVDAGGAAVGTSASMGDETD